MDLPVVPHLVCGSSRIWTWICLIIELVIFLLIFSLSLKLFVGGFCCKWLTFPWKPGTLSAYCILILHFEPLADLFSASHLLRLESTLFWSAAQAWSPSEAVVLIFEQQETSFKTDEFLWLWRAISNFVQSATKSSFSVGECSDIYRTCCAA